jgi:adenine phosphoribosyltransferase
LNALKKPRKNSLNKMEIKLLKKSIEDAKVMKRGGYSYFIHPLTDSIPPINPNLMKEVCSALSDAADFDCDYILTMEAMGIHIGAILSQMTGAPLNIIRKREYGLEDEIELGQKTGYSRSKMYINNVKRGDVVTVVDAVISTGGTMSSTLSALSDAGAIVKDVICVIERGDGVSEVMEKTGFNVKTLVKIDVQEKVTIVRTIN